MKQGKERLIYSNYNLGSMWDDAVESLKENGIENPTDKEVESEIWYMDSINWEDTEEELTKFIRGSYFVLQGEIGTWQGRCEGGFVFSSLRDLTRAWSSCDYVKLYDVNGHFYIECSHHDGTNCYEVRQLNERGREYYERYCYTNERQFHNRLMTSRYSHLPNYVHRVYGCPKREYKK